MKNLSFPGVLLALTATILPAHAQRGVQAPDADLDTIRKLLEVPESRVDFAVAKLTFDRMVDPRIDIAKNIKRLDEMVVQIKSNLPINASSREKIESLKKHLYQAGEWNANHPFVYDFESSIDNLDVKLLPNYIVSRKGNCVSMPFLFLALGQKLGIDVTASIAPEHVFVKFRDETEHVFNLETTSGGGFTSDAWIQKESPMTSQALASGIYMARLTKKETVVAMLDTLLEHYGKRGQQKRRITLARLALEHYPKDISAMLHIHGAYGQLVATRFQSKYRSPKEIPKEEIARYKELNESAQRWRSQAESLGWREPNVADLDKYRQVVDLAKSASTAGKTE